MIHVNIFVTSMSAERFWKIDRPMPPHVQFRVNINVLDLIEESTIASTRLSSFR